MCLIVETFSSVIVLNSHNANPCLTLDHIWQNNCPKLIDRCQILNHDLLPKMQFANVLLKFLFPQDT